MEASLEANVMRRFCVGDMLRRAAINHPKKEAIVYSYKGKITKRVTMEELNQEGNRFANAIMKLGIKKGDRVAVISHNCPQWYVFIAALSKMGAWITPLNFVLRGEEITRLIKHSESIMFIVEDEIAEHVKGIEKEMPSVKHYAMINLSGEKSLPEGWLDFDELCSEKYSDEEPYVEINGDDVLTLMYTSGTEAMPKGVLNSHGNWYSSVMTMALDFGSVMPAEETVSLGAIPIFHVAGHFTVLSQMAQATKSMLLYEPVPQEVIQLMQGGEITSGALSPTVIINLLSLPGGDELVKKTFGSLKTATLYGAPAPYALMQRIMDALPNCFMQNYYGQSELTPLGTTLKAPDLLRKFAEAEERFGGAEPIGQSHAMVEMKVVDNNDNEVPPGTVGEMVARSPSAMLGYYKEEEKTRESFRGGWLHTGDLAIMDEEHFFYFVDRKKDIVKSGGENVSSVEVEGVISKHPKVSECTVVGLPHPRWIEGVAAFVVPKSGESIAEEEIIGLCKEKLAGYKLPKKVIVLNELPKNPSGKILKKELRKEYQDTFAAEK